MHACMRVSASVRMHVRVRERIKPTNTANMNGWVCTHRPEHSAKSNLVSFGGDREAVSDQDLAECAYYAKYSFAA